MRNGHTVLSCCHRDFVGRGLKVCICHIFRNYKNRDVIYLCRGDEGGQLFWGVCMGVEGAGRGKHVPQLGNQGTSPEQFGT